LMHPTENCAQAQRLAVIPSSYVSMARKRSCEHKKHTTDTARDRKKTLHTLRQTTRSRAFAPFWVDSSSRETPLVKLLTVNPQIVTLSAQVLPSPPNMGQASLCLASQVACLAFKVTAQRLWFEVAQRPAASSFQRVPALQMCLMQCEEWSCLSTHASKACSADLPIAAAPNRATVGF